MGRALLLGAVAAVVLGALGTRAAAAPGATLVVIVTSEASQVVLEGAEVAVWTPERMWAARTGKDGHARFTDLPPGLVTVYAAAEGHTAAEKPDVPVAEAAEATLSFALAPGIPFDGTVLDAEGKPAAHVDVVVEAGGAHGGTSDLKPDHPPYARTVTNAKGRFHVRGIPPGAVGTVVVRAAGHAEPRVGVRATAAGVQPSPLEIRLELGCSVRGTVRDPAGKPFAGAQVFAVPASEPGLQVNPRALLVSSDGTTVRALTAVVEADGTYVIEGLPLSKGVVVAAEGDPHARSAWVGPLTADLERRELQADLVLRRHAVLILRVQDAGGAPIADAHVTFDSPTQAPPARLAGMGRLEFNGMWPGEHVVRVTKQGYREVRKQVVLVEGKVHEFEIVLAPGVAIAGVLLDAKGQPLVGIAVEAVCKEPEPPGEPHAVPAARAVTDAQGRFVLGGLRKGRHELAVRAEDLWLAEPRVFAAPAADVKVHARRLAPLPGR